MVTYQDIRQKTEDIRQKTSVIHYNSNNVIGIKHDYRVEQL